MVSFISTYINISVFAYIIYSLIIISLIRLITKFIYKTDSNISSLTNDEFYVLNNKYDFKNFFYFITYKLYKNKSLILNSGQNKFSLNSSFRKKLNDTEMQVLDFYKNNNSPKDFNPEDFDDSIFKQHYDSILNDLKSRNFFKSKNNILVSKVLFYLGLAAISIPGIVITILLIMNKVSPSRIVVSLIINIALYILLLQNTTSSEFTPKGLMAYKAFKNKCSNAKNSDSNSDIHNLIIQNHYMYYFVSDDDNDDDDGDDD